jgi:large subunit ribosomal protein L13
MKTFHLKGKEIQKKWWLIDIKKSNTNILGRLATKIAVLLRGKHKADYTPHLDCGDNVILINAEHIKVSGQKTEQKIYYRHSGYFGHLKSRTYSEQFEKDPTFVIKEAVKGMIRRNTLRRYILKHFYVYTGENHPHNGQNPELIEEI